MIQTTTRPGFTQVNLLPPENRERQASQRKIRLIAVIGAVVVAALVLFSFMESSKAAKLQAQVARQDAANATYQAQVAELQPYATLQQSLTDRQTLERTAMAGDVSWSKILHQLSGIVPQNVWLTSIAGTVAPPQSATAPTGTPNTGVIGSLTFQCDSIDTDGLVQWLRSLVSVPGWANAWVSSAQKTAVGSTPVWQCSSSVDLTRATLAPIGGAR